MTDRKRLWNLTRPVLAVTIATLLPAAIEAQTQARARPAGPDSVTVIPSPKYARSGAHRFFFGDHYRRLWTTAITVQKLNLETFAGGLHPTKKGGGLQSKTLRLRGADGRVYQFRPVDKDGTAILPEELRETLVGRLVQDQVSSIYPAGAVVVPPILSAAGILHVQAVLAVMPDDPALGEYRASFANTLGTIEERPRAGDDEGLGFAGAKEVVSSDDLLKRLEESSSVRVDSRELLLARLTDVFLGDWDRHADQWRWALLEDGRGRRWLPIPRDRDYAFARFDGMMFTIFRRRMPQLTNFGADYPSIEGATWNGRDLDRRLLTDLERPVWDSVARVLQARVSDVAIDSAVQALPPEHRTIDGSRLATALRTRRDGLRAMADRYYRLLAGEVDIHGSDQADRARVTRIDDRTVEVTMARANGAGSEPYYRRRFTAGETHDIRIYLHGGDDTATTGGQGSGGGLTVRFIGGSGNDRFVDSSRAGHTVAYDSLGTDQAVGVSIHRRPYRDAPPWRPGGLAIGNDTRPRWGQAQRDWGSHSLLDGIAGFGPDVGLLLGVTGSRTSYAFRKKPYATRLRYQAALSAGAASGRAAVGARIFRENSRFFFDIEGRASGIEVINWHGLGNNTTLPTGVPPSFYRATEQLLSFQPQIGWQLGPRSQLTLGPYVSYSIANVDAGRNLNRFIHTDRPYGAGNFALVGAKVALDVDTRETGAGIGRTGIAAHLSGSVQPKALDVEQAYGAIESDVATYLAAHIPGTPTLALHGGARKVWGAAGKIPFFDAATIGSASTLRGFGINRFAGDAAVYGSAELRVRLTRLALFVPGQQGVFGFYDVGRVYLEAETSDMWHSGFGGGVWLAFLTPASAVSAGVGHSTEGNRFYLRTGFAF